jgi:hypothetical protein
MVHEFAGLVVIIYTSTDLRVPLAQAGIGKAKMNKTIAYCKPNIVVLGSVTAMICATHITRTDRANRSDSLGDQPSI